MKYTIEIDLGDGDDYQDNLKQLRTIVHADDFVCILGRIHDYLHSETQFERALDYLNDLFLENSINIHEFWC